MKPAAAAPRTRILVAGTPGLRDRLMPVLRGHEVAWVERLEEAVGRYEREEQYGMVIVGVSFDDSQMFELLERLRSGKRKPSIPIVCMLPARHGLSRVLMKGLDHAVKALMANAFLNLDNYPEDEEGNGQLRQVIDYLILIDGQMHSGM